MRRDQRSREMHRCGGRCKNPNIALSHQLVSHFQIVCLLKIQADILLIAIHAQKVRAFPLEKGRSPTPGVIPLLWLLHFYDFHPKIP